ncbi:acyl-homoserine-lactone synthase [Methylobacter tundripaludum]|nr:acyl-homoserine-lactone synthase [Methylobacter tundripaludum]
MMIHVVTGRQEELPHGLYSKVAHYRHKVFVERLGWQLQTFNYAEQDQFDRFDTVYVISRDERGNISGCARLLPTTQPYLLGDVFPQLLNGMPPPNSPDVWELSRFAAVDFNAKTSCALGQFSSPITITLLQEAIAYAASQGAKRVITVSPVGVERLLKRTGFHSHRAGPPMVVDGHPIFACWIDIADEPQY